MSWLSSIRSASMMPDWTFKWNGVRGGRGIAFACHALPTTSVTSLRNRDPIISQIFPSSADVILPKEGHRNNVPIAVKPYHWHCQCPSYLSNTFRIHLTKQNSHTYKHGISRNQTQKFLSDPHQQVLYRISASFGMETSVVKISQAISAHQ